MLPRREERFIRGSAVVAPLETTQTLLVGEVVARAAASLRGAATAETTEATGGIEGRGGKTRVVTRGCESAALGGVRAKTDSLPHPQLFLPTQLVARRETFQSAAHRRVRVIFSTWAALLIIIYNRLFFFLPPQAPSPKRTSARTPEEPVCKLSPAASTTSSSTAASNGSVVVSSLCLLSISRSRAVRLPHHHRT